MKGYLMDTNHVAAWEAEHPGLMTKMRSLPAKTMIFTPAIVLGEILAGHDMTSGDLQRRHKVMQFLNLNAIPWTICVAHGTAKYYGQIIGRIWKSKSPPKATVKTDAHLVQLGIGVNDVWIAASAWEHGLVLLTKDKMEIIRELVTEVDFECWI